MTPCTITLHHEYLIYQVCSTLHLNVSLAIFHTSPPRCNINVWANADESVCAPNVTCPAQDTSSLGSPGESTACTNECMAHRIPAVFYARVKGTLQALHIQCSCMVPVQIVHVQSICTVLSDNMR